MSKTAKFQYKCRLCGEIDSNPCTSEENALFILLNTIKGVKPEARMYIGPQPSMISIHASCKAGQGVTDLIGYIVEEG